MGFMETSAKLKVNIEETFDLIVRRVVEARKELGQSPQFARQRMNEKRPEFPEPKTNMVDDRDPDSACCKCCIIC